MDLSRSSSSPIRTKFRPQSRPPTRQRYTLILSVESADEVTGLAVFTIVKAGFVFSGKAGSGLVIARLPDGSWSAPSCIATAGVGWGLQIGAGGSHSYLGQSLLIELGHLDLTEVVIVLNSDEAVKAFSRGGNVTVGGEQHFTLSAED